MDLDIAVSAKGRVSGNMVAASSRHDRSSSVDVEEEISPPDGLPISLNEPYEDADFVGRRFTFKDVPLKTFNDVFGPEGEGLVIVREEDTFRVEGTVDLTSEEPAPENGVPSEVRIAITFPGPVMSSSGSVEGAHVEWRPALGRKTQIVAVARAFREDGASRWAAVLGLGTLAFLGMAVSVFISRRRRQESAAAEP
jgi:hypothetical protein